MNDDFNEETFDEDDVNEDGTHDMDDISQGSEDDKVDVASADEETLLQGQVLWMMCWRTSTGLSLVARTKVILL